MGQLGALGPDRPGTADSCNTMLAVVLQGCVLKDTAIVKARPDAIGLIGFVPEPRTMLDIYIHLVLNYVPTAKMKGGGGGRYQTEIGSYTLGVAFGLRINRKLGESTLQYRINWKMRNAYLMVLALSY